MSNVNTRDLANEHIPLHISDEIRGDGTEAMSAIPLFREEEDN